MYIRDRIGEVIEVSLGNNKSELRTITDIVSNTENNPVVVWASKNSEGACMPSIWDGWKTGKTPYA